MKKPFATINDLHNYFVGMRLGRPGDNHPRLKHAGAVEEIIYELCGHVIDRADANSIEVGTRMSAAGNRNETNMFWFTVRGTPYALVYRHANGGYIDLCDRGRTGGVRASFNNSTTRSVIIAAFAAL
jgi:hypothetical protein